VQSYYNNHKGTICLGFFGSVCLLSHLLDQKTIITQALERQKQKQTKETIYYSNRPEKLLGMINLHFAKLELEAANKKDETPNYEEVLEATYKQIEEAKSKSSFTTACLKVLTLVGMPK